MINSRITQKCMLNIIKDLNLYYLFSILPFPLGRITQKRKTSYF